MRATFLILGLFALAGCPKEQPRTPTLADRHTVVPATGETTAPSMPSPKQLVTTSFKVEGMTCADCSKAIETKLIGMAGVTTASADDKAGKAIVQYDAGKVTKADIIMAINSLKFRASVMD